MPEFIERELLNSRECKDGGLWQRRRWCRKSARLVALTLTAPPVGVLHGGGAKTGAHGYHVKGKWGRKREKMVAAKADMFLPEFCRLRPPFFDGQFLKTDVRVYFFFSLYWWSANFDVMHRKGPRNPQACATGCARTSIYRPFTVSAKLRDAKERKPWKERASTRHPTSTYCR